MTYAVFGTFVEIKVENELTWSFISFSKKKKLTYGLTCFFFSYVILHWSKSIWKSNQIWKMFESQFEPSWQYFNPKL